MKRSPLSHGVLAALVAMAGLMPAAHAGTPEELLASYTAKAAGVPSPERGQKLFTTNFGRDFGWSCSSCHGAVPTKTGKDEATGKLIAPLAPAFNAKRFTDPSRVDYLFGLNCKDVVGRACTAAEKADVLSWLMTLKP